MGKFVDISKYKQIEYIHHYKVDTSDFGGDEFYMEIDTKTKIMNIYKDEECQQFACFYNFNKPDEPILCKNKGINERLIPDAMGKIYKALQNNKFLL